MGKIVKYCTVCEEGFAEKFSFFKIENQAGSAIPDLPAGYIIFQFNKRAGWIREIM